MPTRKQCARSPFEAKAAAAALLTLSLTAGSALAGDTWTALSSGLNPSVYGQTSDITATVYGSAPTGTVTFKDGAATLGTDTLSVIGVGETISAGAGHSCVVTATGAAMCWGDNTDGQLGNGASGTTETAPVAVTGLSSSVVEVEAGKDFTCALADAGAVKCWGENYKGELGNGTTTASSIPVQVTGLTSGVVAIAAGFEHACALTDAGAVKCWGENDHGQIGDDTGIVRHVPVAVTGLSSGIAAIDANGHTTCAVTDAGAAKCWGYNAHGQIGDGTLASRYVPVDVAGLASGVETMAVGVNHTCALTAAGAVQCWGDNGDGQLGDGTTTDHITPAPVSGLASGVADVDSGDMYTCAVTDAGEIQCWGTNSNDQLGNGGGGDQLVPGTVVGATTNGALVDAGWYHACALTINGAAKCWGNNADGQVGDGTTTNRTTPVAVSGFGINTAMVPGTAAYSTDDLSAGIHSITAVYAGDAENDASTSPALSHDVDKGETKVKKIKLTPKKPKTGKTVRIKVEMEAKAPAVGTPEGKVVIKDGKKKLGKFEVNSKGKASIKVKDLSAGAHTIKAKYKGDDNWKKSDDTEKVTVRD
jgi:alpha-tubulin suppressor-like RCC1 family protein